MAKHRPFSLAGRAGYLAAFTVLAVFFFTLGDGVSIDPLSGVLLLLMGGLLGFGFNALMKRGAREAEREFHEHYLDALEDEPGDGDDKHD